MRHFLPFFESATGRPTRSTLPGTAINVNGSELIFAILGDRQVAWHMPRKTATFHLRGCSLCLVGVISVGFGERLGRGEALPAQRRRALAQQELRPGRIRIGSAGQIRLLQKRQSGESQNVTNEPNSAQVAGNA